MAQFHLLQEAPLAALEDPDWVRAPHDFSLSGSGPYLPGAGCQGPGRGGLMCWQGPQHSLVSPVTLGLVNKQMRTPGPLELKGVIVTLPSRAVQVKGGTVKC